MEDEATVMWNAENILLLRKLWSHGQSAGQIAERLDFSRSAVSAKLKRLGLKRGHKPPTCKPVILAARSASSGIKRYLPVRRRRKRHVEREEYSQRQLYAMLSEAVKNTGKKTR